MNDPFLGVALQLHTWRGKTYRTGPTPTRKPSFLHGDKKLLLPYAVTGKHIFRAIAATLQFSLPVFKRGEKKNPY